MRPIFYGWWIVVAGFVIQGLNGGLLFHAFSAYILPLQADPIKPLVSGAYQQILDTHQGQPFLVALWSVDCPPCHEELSLLGEYIGKNPAARIVLISADEVSLIDPVQQILARYGLDGVEAWK